MRKSVFVVDNQYQNTLKLCKQTLEPTYSVQGTTSHREASETLSKQSIDLLIAAPMFDGVHGYDFIERVYKNYPDLMTILILQEHEETSQMIMELLKKAEVKTNYLRKPVKPEDLSAKVRELIGEWIKPQPQHLNTSSIS